MVPSSLRRGRLITHLRLEYEIMTALIGAAIHRGGSCIIEPSRTKGTVFSISKQSDVTSLVTGNTTYSV